MSRRDLLNACQRLGVRTEVVAGGKRRSKDNHWLRTDLIDRTYGPGMQWKFKSAAEADHICVRAVHCRLGGFGHLLALAQACLRDGNDALTEYKRLCGLKRRRPNDEAAALDKARKTFDKARSTHEQWEAKRRATVQR